MLEVCGGNRTLAAQHLGITRQTLAKKVGSEGAGPEGRRRAPPGEATSAANDDYCAQVRRRIRRPADADHPPQRGQPTMSALVWTRSLPLMWPRWVSTVLMLIPKRPAICLFELPHTTRSKI